jgi:peptidoglycan/LPS O-acetylase OafA/YrhL
MARRRNAADERRRRKLMTVLWVSLLALATIILIYKEHTALLYILATLGITALLVVVALADLGHAEKLTNEARHGNDSGGMTSGGK